MLLDRVLPTFDVESAHSTHVQAAPDAVLAEARRADLSASWIIRLLFRLRGMPASALTLEGLERIRFKPILEEPGRGFVIGLVGKFWTPRGHLLDFDPARFVELDEPGYAKAVWSFEVEEAEGATRLHTATRVRCMDALSRRWFRAYWALIGPFSGLVRTETLRVIKRAAEERAGTS